MSFSPIVPFPKFVTLRTNYHGRSYTILVQSELATELFPEFTIGDALILLPHLSQTFGALVLEWHKSTIDNFFGKNSTVSTYCHSWTLLYCLVDGEATLQNPQTNHGLCFNGTKCDSRLPIYDPRKIYVEDVLSSSDDAERRLLVRIDKNQLECIVPDLFKASRSWFDKFLEQELHAMDNYKRTCLPEIRGLVGLRKDGVGYVVGILYETVRGVPLSNLLVPAFLRSGMRARIQEGYENLISRSRFWHGEGPEHILVREDGQAYFTLSKLASYKPQKRSRDITGIEKVMLSLPDQPGSGLRRSRRMQEQDRTWAKKRIEPQQRLTILNLPLEIRQMIYQYFLKAPERVFWAWDTSQVIPDSGVANPQTRRWDNDGLARLLWDAHLFFVENNHFYVDMVRLPHFLKWSRDPSKIKQITISVHGGSLDGGRLSYQEIIEMLVSHCPELKSIGVVIYGDNGIEDLDSWLENHLVLHELRRRFKKRISSIKYLAWGMDFAAYGATGWRWGVHWSTVNHRLRQWLREG